MRYKSHRYHTYTSGQTKRYRFEQTPFKQTLVPWAKEQLVAEVGCLEADLRFAYIAHAGLPRYTDNLGLVDKLRDERRFEPDDIALFRAFLELFSETCDERALPLVGSRSESVWKGGSRGGVAGGWNAACQSLVTWYIPGQTVQTAASQALTEPLKASTYSQPLRLDAA